MASLAPVIFNHPSSDKGAKDKCTGLILGLAAGDRNGGPIQMALVLGESLVARNKYEPVESFFGYSKWYDQGKGTDAWDTGPTSRKLLHVNSALAVNKNMSKEEYLRRLEERSLTLDKQLSGLTAGVNAAHRVAPLAVAWFLDDTELIESARQESRLTHWSSISQDTCAIVALLCRMLIQGNDFQEAVRNIVERVNELAPDNPIIIQRLQEGFECSFLEADNQTTGGFCPEVLKAAIHFVAQTSTFEDALDRSIAFAGPSNYCPVLVGAIAGALYGALVIPKSQLSHCRPGIVSRCMQMGSKADAHFQNIL